MPLIVPLLLAAAALPPAAKVPTALPRFETLIDQTQARAKPDDPLPPETFCTADKRWCLELTRGADNEQQSLRVFDGRKPGQLVKGAEKTGWSYETGQKPQESGFDRSATHLWPQILREAAAEPREGEERGETISIGLLLATSTMYSGGGGNAEHLNLYRLEFSSYGKPRMQEVLGVPLSANLMIRACFSEKDYKLRRGVCHDEYSFEAKLALDSANPGPPPGLIYTAESDSMPGSSERMNDNSGRQLSKAELAPRADTECTFQRKVAYNPVTDRYEFDRPGPDCSDFTVP